MNNKINDHAIRVVTIGIRITQEPLYPKGHPNRIEQNSQNTNKDAPS